MKYLYVKNNLESIDLLFDTLSYKPIACSSLIQLQLDIPNTFDDGWFIQEISDREYEKLISLLSADGEQPVLQFDESNPEELLIFPKVKKETHVQDCEVLPGMSNSLIFATIFDECANEHVMVVDPKSEICNISPESDNINRSEQCNCDSGNHKCFREATDNNEGTNCCCMSDVNLGEEIADKLSENETDNEKENKGGRNMYIFVKNEKGVYHPVVDLKTENGGKFYMPNSYSLKDLQTTYPNFKSSTLTLIASIPEEMFNTLNDHLAETERSLIQYGKDWSKLNPLHPVNNLIDVIQTINYSHLQYAGGLFLNLKKPNGEGDEFEIITAEQAKEIMTQWDAIHEGYDDDEDYYDDCEDYEDD